MGSLSGSLGQPFGQTFNMDPGNGQTYNLPSTDVNKLPSWAQPYKGTYTLPTLADLQNTPGYQFQLQQGLQGVDRGAAARGGLNTGGTLKAENNYAQGLAGTTYQNAVANSLGAFNTNYGVYQGNQSAASNAYGQQVNAGLSAFGANQGAYNNMYGNALNGFNSNFNVWNTGGNSLANRYYNLAYLGTLQ